MKIYRRSIAIFIPAIGFRIVPILIWCLPAFSVSTALHAMETIIYGIDDSSRIVQMTLSQNGNQFSGSIQSILATGLTGEQNAFAYDTVRDQMFFVSSAAPGAGFSPKSLYLWDRGSSVSLLADSTQIGVAGGIPANAVFYSNAFWFFDENDTDDLVRVNLSYSGGLPSFSSTQRYGITGYPNSSTYGDIAIDKNTGILYGATSQGLFFSLDVSVATPGGYTQIKASGTGNPSLQLAFSPDYATLFGQSYTDGKWYTIDKATGNVTDINVTSPAEFRLRDLGGSSITPVPEPSTWMLGTVGVTTFVILTRNRKTANREAPIRS